MDTERPDEPDSTGEAYEPVDLDIGVDEGNAAYADVVAEPKSRMLLATLAALVVVVVGIAAWAQLYYWRNNNYVGISVVFGLLIGYVVREVSRRSDLPARILAALVTAVLCVVGLVSATAVGIVLEVGADYWTTFRGLMKEPWTVIRAQPVLTLVILGAAVVVAFFSTAPAKPKKAKVAPAPAPAAEPADPFDEG